jgi:hypothetical protein
MTIDLLSKQRLQVVLPDGSHLYLDHSGNNLYLERKVDGRLDTLIRIPLTESPPAP